MNKPAFVTLISLVLPLILAPIAPIMAQEAPSDAGAVIDTFQMPTSPLGDFFTKFLGEGQIDLKQAVQGGMDQAQTGLKDAAGQALDTAQDALKAEISKQADKAVQETRQKAEAYVGGVVAAIKNFVSEIISKIKIFFVDLFTKTAPTY